MKKAFLIIFILLVAWAVLRFVVGGPEDTWICDEAKGEWVKHGAPDAPMPTEPCGEVVCKNYDVDNCPEKCVICPPCMECSSISCQTEEFCKNMGFDKDWYDSVKPAFLPEEIRFIADSNKECSMTGILTNNFVYNENSKTWWIDLERMPELEKDGCNPACVVNEEVKTAEVNWRCTGAMPEVECKEEQRNVDACIELYQPVCATVNIQCITTPCEPIEETYGNSCKACSNPLVSSYKEGECK